MRLRTLQLANTHTAIDIVTPIHDDDIRIKNIFISRPTAASPLFS
jgi:hypothetical protein